MEDTGTTEVGLGVRVVVLTWVGGEGTVEATSRDMLRIRVTAGWEATVARDLDMDQGSLELDEDLVGVQ